MIFFIYHSYSLEINYKFINNTNFDKMVIGRKAISACLSSKKNNNVNNTFKLVGCRYDKGNNVVIVDDCYKRFIYNKKCKY